jgi:uncharacterized protein YtpQ (UPF0354 family)
VRDLTSLVVSAIVLASQPACHRTEQGVAHESNAAPAPSSQGAPSLSEEAYTTEARDLFREALPDASVEITQPRTIMINLGPGDNGHQVALDRVWQECKTSPASCDRELRHFVEVVVPTMTSEAPRPVAEQIMPALRGVEYVKYMRAQSGGEIAAQPFAADIWVVYFLDEKDRARVVNMKDLAILGMTMEQLRDVALKHLDERLKIVDEVLASTAPHKIGLIRTGSYYDASRLLQTSVWTKATRTRKESLLVAAPSPEFLVFEFAEPTDDGALLAEAAGVMYAKAGRPISHAVLRWTGSGWEQVVGP